MKGLEPREEAKALGKILVERGMLAAADLDHALKAQKESGRRIGEVLVDLGLLKEQALRLALAEQLNLPLVHPDPEALDPEALSLLPVEVCRRYGVLPMYLTAQGDGSERLLTLAAADPTQRSALEDVAQRVGCAIRVVAGLREEIASCLDAIHGPAAASDVEVHSESVSGGSIGEILADPTGTALLSRLLQGALQQAQTMLFFRVREGEGRVEDANGQVIFAGGETWHTILLDRMRRLANLPGVAAKSSILQRGRFSFRVADGLEASLFRVSILRGVDGEEAQIDLLPPEGQVRSLPELGFTPHQCLQAREALSKPGLAWVTTPGEEGLASSLFALLREVPGRGRTFTIEEEVYYRTPDYLQLETMDIGAGERSEVLRELKWLDFQRILVDRASPAQLSDLLALALRRRWVVAGCSQASLEEALRFLSSHAADLPLYGLALLIHQRLVPRLCPGCRVVSALGTGEMKTLERHLPNRGTLYEEGGGCKACSGRGTHGVQAFFEVLRVDAGVREALYGEARGEVRIPALLERVQPTIRGQVAHAVASGEVSLAELWDFV